MPKMLLTALILVSVMTPANLCWATPSASVWVQVMPLGYNREDYFFLRTENRNPGSYYEGTETVSVVRCRLKSGEVVETIVIQQTEYVDTDTFGSWERRDKPSKPFDLASYLREHKIHLAFPASFPEHWRVRRNRLVDVSDTKPQVIMKRSLLTRGVLDPQQQGDPSDPEEEQVRLKGVWSVNAPDQFRIPAGRLLVVQTGRFAGESDARQNVVFVKSDP